MRDFLMQLSKRHVVRVAIAYLIFAWVVLQIADIVLPALGLSDWAITVTLVLLAAGFPVALILAWVFDITPEGIVRTDTPKQQRSIAVLPFADMSADHDQEHFCDGLTDELLAVLTRIPDLRVASRTSSFAYKNHRKPLPVIAADLRVGHILEGSVRKDGDRVRITAQLTDAGSDSQLWAATWDRELCDLFAIQRDIATRILSALKIRLGDGELRDPTTANAKAYEYYLRARGYAITTSAKDLETAQRLYGKAVKLDPEFVRGWIGIAEAAMIQAIFMGGGEAARELADKAGRKALKLAPDRPSSHMAFGFSQLACQCLDDADRAFKKVLEIDPDQVRAYHYLARTAHHRGDVAEELAYFHKATELDPEDWESPVLALAAYDKKGDQAGARKAARTGIERIEAHLEDYPDNPRAYYFGVGALEFLGEQEKALEWADKALAIAPDDPATRYNLACFYARKGDIERALDLLENSISSRSWIENDLDLESLRDHPRYRAIVEALPVD